MEKWQSSLIENIQREDLSPYEKGKALKAMKGNMTNEQLAERVGLSVRRMMDYLAVGNMDKTVCSALHTDDTTVMASISTIADKSLQLKVAEALKLPFFGVKEAWEAACEG